MRSRNDIESVISGYVELKRSGARLKGLCPFHNEKTPSFTVFPDTESFHCFGCGEGGDVIYFISKIENLTYVDAVKMLAERSGLALPDGYGTDPAGDLRKRCYEANREAARFFYASLYEEGGREALEYLRKRSITKESITRFGLGYAPQSGFALLNHLRSKGFTDTELLSADLIKKSSRTGHYYDSFRNRMMVPIIDVRGNVIAFGGRVLDDSKPKYINTSDTPVFKKGQGLFALNKAKSSGRKLILCEGYMDVIAFHQYGFTNAVAGLGTALTPEQVSLISKYADEVALCYDSDEAGIKATNKALELFSKTNIKVKVIKMRGGKDPDEILRTKGAEYMRLIISESKANTQFRLAAEKEKHDLNTPDGKTEYATAAVGILAALSNEIEREVYLGRLADETGIPKEVLSAQLKNMRRRSEKSAATRAFDEANKNISGGRKLPGGLREKSQSGVSKAQRILISSLFRSPEYIRSLDGLTPEDFPDTVYKIIIEKIIARAKSGAAVSLTVIGSELAPEQVAVLSGILAEYRDFPTSVRECLDCIAVLKKEKNKFNPDTAASLSDEEFRNLFKKKAGDSN